MKIHQYIIITFAMILIACENQSANKTSESKTETVAGETTSTFKVWGNCDMCKETIEGSLKVEGITEVDWGTETKMIKVVYDSSKISLDQIQKNIAAVGYDNEKYKGDDYAYENLHGCCQYDRK